jgi:hypothetical protein
MSRRNVAVTFAPALIGSLEPSLNVHDAEHVGRIDHIFLLENFEDNHIFVVVTPLQRTHLMDPVLSCEVLKEQPDQPTIVGITAIQPSKLYMVSVDGVGTVWVKWDLHTL